MLYRSSDSAREFTGWNQLPCGPVLTPNISCTKLKIHSAHADSPIVPKQILSMCRQFGCRTSLYFTDQETQEENLQGGTSSLVGQFLHPISLVQSSRYIQRMQTVQLLLNKFCLCTGNLDVGPVYASQIRNSRREFEGGTSSLVGQFLHPISLYKAQDPYSACRQSCQIVPKQNFILSKESGCRTSLCFTDQETQKENFQGEISSLVDQFLHPISLVQSARSIQHMQTVQLFQNRF